VSHFLNKLLDLKNGCLDPIVVLQGGLGNQLSQWSFAHTLTNSTCFSIDPLHNFGESQSREFELKDVFRNCEHVRKNKAGDIRIPRIRVLFRSLDRLWEVKRFRHLVETFGYLREDPRIDQEQSSVNVRSIRYAKGYFQKQQNVETVFDSVRKEIIPLVEEILPKIRGRFGLDSEYSVLHVRRGDYEAAVFTPTIIGTLSDEYFVNGIQALDSSKLILLTENRDDVKELILVLRPHLVLDKFDTTPWETLSMIYGASQFLGSNSSLSWWGARLCSDRGGQVWLPSEWSFWKNIEVNDYHFKGCKIAESCWVQNAT
jgi:hypothetical protein